MTIPSWLLAARLAEVPTLCHVHEAEADQPRVVRLALAAPLLLARRVVTNSEASGDVLCRSLPALADASHSSTTVSRSPRSWSPAHTAAR